MMTLLRFKNENAIARSIRNIVFTLPGEKFFNASFGSRITESLFENIDDITSTIIVDEITQSIENYEDQESNYWMCKASPNYDNNSYDLTIRYLIIGRDIPAQELQLCIAVK